MALVIAYLFKTGGKKSVEQVGAIPMESSNDIGTSVGHFKSTA